MGQNYQHPKIHGALNFPFLFPWLPIIVPLTVPLTFPKMEEAKGTVMQYMEKVKGTVTNAENGES